ncbi:hypothetical protein [Malacoplasma iowae]|uniref:Uncharacterized protein n=1 Tax=Malacoplasma iowae 695 TaxID=1048830 RepID=A0A6P1LHA3_MALIO|nr:hypothetical protein [Malacoplasma iowae]VEU62014.1 Uncharacterised protein [Mycoplasmopsis fermentans]EGZ31581.1 hypothetical protein GUU_01147 [Malacoplasma iowae 695]QHG90010.1 hypothetical protein EER00_03900 [Malacoplasma iowae 695]WPL36264.1 hypothetical protein QX180_02500 [Malacoplasma iowae]VEU70652.1 Uncharacterised protein [Malacoplasma iowae]
MFFKKNKDKKAKDEYRKQLLEDNRKEETTKIDIHNFNLSKTEDELTYERYSSLSTRELKYRLANDTLTKQEKEIIKKILNER